MLNCLLTRSLILFRHLSRIEVLVLKFVTQPRITKMRGCLLFTLIVLSLLVLSNCNMVDEPTFDDDNYPDDWVDPWHIDLGGDDIVQSSDGGIKETEKKRVEDMITEGADSNESNLQACRNPIFRRYVSILHSKLEEVSEFASVEKYEIEVEVDETQLSILKDYAGDCRGNAHDVASTLETMIFGIRPHSSEQNHLRRKFEDFFNMDFWDVMKILCVCFTMVAILSMEIFSKVSWGLQLKRLFFIGLIVSYFMTYYHEIQRAEAKARSKTPEIPEHCVKDYEELSYFSMLRLQSINWFSVKNSNDRCKEYHEIFLIHPMVEVNPIKVFVITLTKVTLEPLEHMGTAFSKAFKNIFTDLPVTLWVPAFVFVVLVIVGFMLVIAVLFGYNFSINLPFWAGLQMAPPAPMLPPNDMELNQLRIENRDLRDRIEALEEQPPPLRLPPASPYPRDLTPPYPEDRAPPHQYPEADLPYPDFQNNGARGDGLHHGLRRRHTCSEGMNQRGPIPSPPYPVQDHVGSPIRQSSANLQRDIGFEKVQKDLCKEVRTSDTATQQDSNSDETQAPCETSPNNGVSEVSRSPKRECNSEFPKTYTNGKANMCSNTVKDKDITVMGMIKVPDVGTPTILADVVESINHADGNEEQNVDSSAVESTTDSEEPTSSENMKDVQSVEDFIEVPEPDTDDSSDNESSIEILQREAGKGFSLDSTQG